jgi:HEAT repeat protein
VDSLPEALQCLHSDRPERIGEGLEYPRVGLGALPEAEFRGAVEQLCALFYVDTADRPDLQPLLDRAVALLAAQGPRVISQLLELMKGSDIKSHLYLARTLAYLGQPALPALRRVIATEDPYSRSFALFAENVPASQLGEDRRAEILEVLFRTLSDAQPAVRAKAVRSLGKLVRAAYLSPDQEARVRSAVLRILGQDEAHEWDRAFIVRREAEVALRHIEARL